MGSRRRSGNKQAATKPSSGDHADEGRLNRNNSRAQSRGTDQAARPRGEGGQREH